MGKKGMPGFTRGGLPVTTDPGKVHAHPKQRKGKGNGTNYAEPIAIGIAGGLTVGAVGLIGGALAGGGMDNRFSNKRR
jgi:energy-converting hydrogenase Eha subunit F